MKRSAAEIVREYGPFPGVDSVNGLTYDGERVWFAAGDRLIALDPASGKTLRTIDVAAHAGTAFDGKHLFQIAEDRIQKIDPKTGRVLATIPAPGGGRDSGLAWAEGTLCSALRQRKARHAGQDVQGKTCKARRARQDVEPLQPRISGLHRIVAAVELAQIGEPAHGKAMGIRLSGFEQRADIFGHL